MRLLSLLWRALLQQQRSYAADAAAAWAVLLTTQARGRRLAWSRRCGEQMQLRLAAASSPETTKKAAA